MQSGDIDGISATSQFDPRHSVEHGRLHFQETPYQAGSWVAKETNKDQWFQVDLGNQETYITGVATQGRNYNMYWPYGPHSQWVTKYKVDYSNDGKHFQYYREQGQTEDKVNTTIDLIV